MYYLQGPARRGATYCRCVPIQGIDVLIDRAHLIFRTEFGPDYGDEEGGWYGDSGRLVRSQRSGQSGQRG